MNPRRFLNSLRSPTGALALFLVGLLILLLLVNSRRPFGGRRSRGSEAASAKLGENAAQLPTTVRRDMVPFNTPSTPKPATPPPVLAKQQSAVPALPPLSLVAETPAAPTKEGKTFSADFAPFGRLIPCELVVTVDSSSIQTPIIGLVTEDIFHHGQLIIPTGTEVHGSATVDRTRERIASNGRWTLVWQNGEELNVSGLALDHERDTDSGTWAISDGSAGLRGRLIKTDNLAEVKLYVAALLSGAADAFTDRQTSAFGSFTLPSLQNAPLKGAQGVLDRYAQQILQTIERDGFYVRVPAGKQFYLYVTQTLDQDDAKIGGTLATSLQPADIASPVPALITQQNSLPQNLRSGSTGSAAPTTSTPQLNRVP
jgi:hypothetical protein